MARAGARCGRREMLVVAVGLLVLAPLAGPTPAPASSPSAEQVVQGLAEDIWTTLTTDGADEDGRVDTWWACSRRAPTWA